MKRNMAKGNWTIEEIGWKLHPPGSISDWDGLSGVFVGLVEKHDPDSNYIKSWYQATKRTLENMC